MKRLFLTLTGALLLTTLLYGQGAANPDSLALRRQIEAENYKVLRQYAAHPAVVAEKRVLRSDFYLWYSHLGDRSWGADRNWYPAETRMLYFARPTAKGDYEIVCSEPIDSALWSVPEPPCVEAVSSGNEIFPMLSPDGRRLYFASDGLFGAGGYDLYVATWDPERQVWGHVQNMGVPFNSPADDLLFCDTPDGRYSLMASNRSCGKDSMVIYVLRQETPVYGPVSEDEAARIERLAVTTPDNGYAFVKQSLGKAPVLYFEEPEEVFDYTFTTTGPGAFAENNSLPAGLVYQIQLFVSGSKPSVSQLKGVSPVYVHPQRTGKKLCAVGLFRSYADAEDALSAVRRKFPSAFIIAFDGGQPLALSKARKKESSVKVVTEEVRIVK